MKSKAHPISELLYERMEVTAIAGRKIADEAKARGGLTRMESCELTLMGIEQDERRHRWAEQLHKEGHYVNLLDDSTTASKDGLRITNRGGERPVVWLYGSIGTDGITEEEFLQEMLSIPSDADIELHIRSDGGDVFTALAMREVIMSRADRTVLSSMA